MPVCKLSEDLAWAIDGVPIYIPGADGVDFDHEGLQSKQSGRAEDGYMIKEWIRRDVRNLTITYPYMTGDEKQLILDLIQGRDFSLDYWDGGPRTIASAYCNKVTYKGMSRGLYAAEGGLYKDVSFKIIEN